MSWEQITQIIIAIIGVLAGATICKKLYKKQKRSSNKEIFKQNAKGDRIIQVGGDINIGRNIEDVQKAKKQGE